MTSDLEAARAFYGALFGWQWEIGGAETHHYSTARIDGRRVAGAFDPQLGHPPVWTTYLAAADADAIGDGVVRAGGSIAQPTTDVMDLGRMAIVQDVTGAVFGTWQAGSHVGVECFNETGAVIWNELLTRDYDAAREFYPAVFGATFTELGDGGFRYSTMEIEAATVAGVGTVPDAMPSQVPAHWRVYFAVDDADEAVARAQELGATVLRPAQDMPYGRNADLADPQGAPFAVIKPAPWS